MTDVACSAAYWARVRGCNPPSVVLHDWDAPPPPLFVNRAVMASRPGSVCVRMNTRMLEWMLWLITE